MTRQKVFLNGIAGTGMSSLAGLFKEAGFDVAGSDNNFYPPIDQVLEKMDVMLFEGYSEANLSEDIDFFVIGNIISRGNPEAEAILNHKRSFYSMAEALHRFFIRKRQSIVAAGTHGKTTISSFVACLLDRAGMDPGFFIGGKPFDQPANYRVGKGDYFVSEGDEYETAFFDRSSKFLKYFPDYLILTALEYDHLDFFKTESQYVAAFRNLINQVPSRGRIIYNRDFPMNRSVVSNSYAPLISYGSDGEDCDYRICNIRFEDGHYYFDLKNRIRERMHHFKSPLLGRYNIWNLAAGIILGFELGLEEHVIAEAVLGFNGVERRLNRIREIGNTVFLEDFAHHHTAVRNTLASVNEAYPEKSQLVLFEPGSFSIKRAEFQEQLINALAEGERIWIKNPFEKKGPRDHQLDIDCIVKSLSDRGKEVVLFENFDDLKTHLSELDFNRNQVVTLLSNKRFGDIPYFIKFTL